MAKLNWESIEGYKVELTAEEKLKLLENYELPSPDYTGYIQKSAFDKTASELAETKRQLKAKMSEEEQKEAERQAEAQALQEELETLRKEKTVSTLRAEYVSLGYSAELAAKAAKAKVDGDTKTELETMKAFLDAQKQAYIKEALEGTPRPPAGNPDGASITKEQVNEMGYSEWLKLYNEQPTLYKQFTGGTE